MNEKQDYCNNIPLLTGKMQLNIVSSLDLDRDGILHPIQNPVVSKTKFKKQFFN